MNFEFPLDLSHSSRIINNIIANNVNIPNPTTKFFNKVNELIISNEEYNSRISILEIYSKQILFWEKLERQVTWSDESV